MKAHLKLRLVSGAAVTSDPPSWEAVARSQATAPERLHAPVDRLLREHRIPVLATREYRPAAGATFSSDEIASGLDRVYRLILQRAGSFPASLVDAIRLVPTVEYARLGRVGAAELPPVVAAAMSVTTDMTSRRAIGLPEAHLLCRGSKSITVAVLDTGVAAEHPELAPVMAPGRDFVDIIDGAGRFIGDFLDADDVADDEVGHGTHVAGIVAGRGLGMPEGVIPECRVLPVRVLARCAATTSCSARDWCTTSTPGSSGPSTAAPTSSR